MNIMAAEQAWMCPICRDEQKDVAYVVPCRHEFCLACILQWAKQRNSCPLCRTVMTVIKVAEWDDNDDLDFVIQPPAQPEPASFQAGIAPAYSPHSSLPSPSLSPLPSPLPFLPLPEEQESEEAEEQDAQEADEEGAEEAVEQWAEEEDEQWAMEEEEQRAMEEEEQQAMEEEEQRAEESAEGEAEETEQLQADEAEELQAEEAEEEPTVGGLLPGVWAALFRQHQQILDPVLPWLRQALTAIFGAQWWPTLPTESIILNALCKVGLDSQALVQEVWPVLEDRAEALIQRLMDTIVCHCGEEALSQLGLQGANEALGAAGQPCGRSEPHSLPTSDPQLTARQSQHAGPAQRTAGCPSWLPQSLPHCSQPEGTTSRQSGAQRLFSSSPLPCRRPAAPKRRADSDDDPEQPCKRLCHQRR